MSYSYNYSVNGAAAAAYIALLIAFYVLVAIGLWKTFVKAGRPGWAGIVPFYNLYVWIQIAGRPTSWFWIMLVCSLLGWIPIIGWLLLIAVWVLSLLVALDNARNFGHGAGFGVLLWLFPMVMFLVLGFGSSHYRQVANVTAGPTAPMPPPPPLAQSTGPAAPPPSLVPPEPATSPPSRDAAQAPPEPPAMASEEAPPIAPQEAPPMPPSQDVASSTPPEGSPPSTSSAQPGPEGPPPAPPKSPPPPPPPPIS